MNNTNENTVFENNEKVKIEYVNPLNPNEVLKINDKLNDIKMPEVETTVEEPVKEISEQGDELIESNNNLKKKKKKKLLFIILTLVLLVFILVGILVIPKFLKKDPVDQTPVVEVQSPQEENKITLSNIISNSTNNVFYNTLTSTYTVNIVEENNSIVFNLNSIDQTNPINKQIIFKLNDRNLNITLNTLSDNTDNLNAIYAIMDSIGQYYGHEIDEVGNYLYSIHDNYKFNVPSIGTLENVDPATGLATGIVEISIDIDANISTNGLETMTFNIDNLSLYSDIIKNNTITLKRGDLVLFTNNNVDKYTILVGERKTLTDNSYNTITSVIQLLYPEEIDSFKSKFTSLSTISFDKYKITVDPVLDANTYPQYQNNYKFVLIEITKPVVIQ